MLLVSMVECKTEIVDTLVAILGIGHLFIG